MRSAVLLEAGEAFPLQELFFALEMHLGEFNEVFELLADALPVATVKQHDAEFIQSVHQDSVLIVHGLYADEALVTPCQQGHCVLHNQGQV